MKITDHMRPEDRKAWIEFIVESMKERWQKK